MEKLSETVPKKGIRKQDIESVNQVRSDEKKGIHKLFLEELREIYWAEGALTKVLHKMHKHANSFELCDELTRQLDVVKGHQLNIGKVFDMLDEKVDPARSRSVEGLIMQAEEFMDETKKGAVRDAGIISYALKIKHFEIAAYVTLCFYARTLGEEMAAGLLQISLDEENLASEKLSQLIESIRFELVNPVEGNG